MAGREGKPDFILFTDTMSHAFNGPSTRVLLPFACVTKQNKAVATNFVLWSVISPNNWTCCNKVIMVMCITILIFYRISKFCCAVIRNRAHYDLYGELSWVLFDGNPSEPILIWFPKSLLYNFIMGRDRKRSFEWLPLTNSNFSHVNCGPRVSIILSSRL